jgi:hypothetical protein
MLAISINADKRRAINHVLALRSGQTCGNHPNENENYIHPEQVNMSPP